MNKREFIKFFEGHTFYDFIDKQVVIIENPKKKIKIVLTLIEPLNETQSFCLTVIDEHEYILGAYYDKFYNFSINDLWNTINYELNLWI